LRRKGFTLVEMMVVTTVLAMLAAFVVPNIVTMTRARDARLSLVQLRDLAREARETAVRDGTSLSLRFDDTRATMQIVRPGDPASTDDNLANDQVLRSVQLANGVTVRTLQLAGQERSASEWDVRFYSDGRADKGGFELLTAGSADNVRILETGEVILASGALPQQEEQTTWPAGEHELRQ
jgi:prepilin-type N-terminal cleavage/methylation domain-containing protein